MIIWKFGIFSFLELSYSYQNYQYKPWLNDEDSKNVFFASLHGYGKLTPTSVDYFYPGSGDSINKVDYVPQNITRTFAKELLNDTDFEIFCKKQYEFFEKQREEVEEYARTHYTYDELRDAQ